MIPYCPENVGGKVYYDNATLREKIVSDYTGLDFERIHDICYFDFLSLLRDAVIYKNSRTKEGREYLEKCWILEQDKPDREKLRERFAKGAK